MSKTLAGGRFLTGKIEIQPSKSAAHRAVICAALAKGRSEIENIALSDDIRATIGCAEALGLARVSVSGGRAVVDGGREEKPRKAVLDCGESGSTMRFFLPIAPLTAGKAEFTGRGRLMERPMEPLRSLLIEKGVRWENPCTLSGMYCGGTFPISGAVSSQFISGLMFALPLLRERCEIRLTTEPESRGYIEMTRQMQEKFGISSVWRENTISVSGRYVPQKVTVEADWSHAAFYAVAGAIGGRVTMTGLDENSAQGDKEILAILKRMGARVEAKDGGITVRGGYLRGTEIDGSQIPDIIPILAVAAAAADGTTRIYGAGRLRMKECDRLAAMAENLFTLGAGVEELQDGLVIHGGRKLTGGRIKTRGDHRIAMAMAVASALTKEEIVIDDGDCVKKSAPAFWEEYESLGGHAV